MSLVGRLGRTSATLTVVRVRPRNDKSAATRTLSFETYGCVGIPTLELTP